MIAEHHGWGTAYYNDERTRCATVEGWHGRGKENHSHTAETFTCTPFSDGVSRFFNLNRRRFDNELACHAIAQAWCSPSVGQ